MNYGGDDRLPTAEEMVVVNVLWDRNMFSAFIGTGFMVRRTLFSPIDNDHLHIHS